MGGDEIKVGMITKRAQQKKSFGPINYKERVFVLTRAKLSYFEGTEQHRGKIKGSINIDTISFVGPINDKALNRTSAFQIIHGGVYLYCCAKNTADRDNWIQSIKHACQLQCGSTCMQMRYHPNIFNNGKWQCCGRTSKNDQGCESVNEYSEEKYHKPLPEIPENEFSNRRNQTLPTLPTLPYPNPGMDSKQYGFDVTNSHNPAPSIPPKPGHVGVSMTATHSNFTSNGTSLNSQPPMGLHLPPLPQTPIVPSMPFHELSAQAQRRNTMSQAQGANTFRDYNPVMENSQVGGECFAEEPPVPSYPHYFTGAKNSETVIQSKPYEHTTPQYLKDPSATEDSKIGKTVVALYDFDPVERDDIELQVGQLYTVLDDTRPHWWYVRNGLGAEGYIPANYVQEEQRSQGIETMSWFQKDMSRQRAEHLLKQEPKEGNFIVRNSTQQSVIFTLSVVSKGGHLSGPFQVKHYHIKENNYGLFYLSEKHAFQSVLELINYHKHNAGGLITRLRNAPVCLQSPDQPSTHLFSNSQWEIDYNDLEMVKELGSGQFGKVNLAYYRKRTKVAVKVMKENAMEEDSFIEEAEVMTRLTHKNLVCLYGVVTKQRPVCIVTEFMENGCLLDYIRGNTHLLAHPDTLLDMCHQVCAAMEFLEGAQLIHRDLAARNCLVGKNMLIKVADFGLTRFVLDDEYTSSLGSKFPIKWAAPEVLNYTKFSSKSDVWAFGVLMWELFSGGKMPFETLCNSDVVDQVARGLRLQRPSSCVKEIYQVMLTTWEMEPERRPSFRSLFSSFYNLIDRIAANCPAEGMYDA